MTAHLVNNKRREVLHQGRNFLHGARHFRNLAVAETDLLFVCVGNLLGGLAVATATAAAAAKAIVVRERIEARAPGPTAAAAATLPSPLLLL